MKVRDDDPDSAENQDLDSPGEKANQSRSNNYNNKEFDALLLEYEQNRLDSRQQVIQQRQIITAGVAALTAISGYAVVSEGSDYFNSLLLYIIPFVTAFFVVLSIEVENNNIRTVKRNTKVKDRVTEIANCKDFRREFEIDTHYVPGTIIKLSSVPLYLLWGISILYLAIHIAIIWSTDFGSSVALAGQLDLPTTWITWNYVFIIVVVVLSVISKFWLASLSK